MVIDADGHAVGRTTIYFERAFDDSSAISLTPFAPFAGAWCATCSTSRAGEFEGSMAYWVKTSGVTSRRPYRHLAQREIEEETICATSCRWRRHSRAASMEMIEGVEDENPRIFIGAARSDAFYQGHADEHS